MKTVKELKKDQQQVIERYQQALMKQDFIPKNQFYEFQNELDAIETKIEMAHAREYIKQYDCSA